MKGKRYSAEPIIGILKEYEADRPAQGLLRKHGIANGTLYRWKAKYGGMAAPYAKRLRALLWVRCVQRAGTSAVELRPLQLGKYAVVLLQV